MPEKIRLGISTGDPNGIGVEIVLKIFEDEKIFDYVTPIIFGPHKLLSYQKKHFNSTTNLFFLNKKEKVQEMMLNVYDLPMPSEKLNFGEESKAAGQLAFESLTNATKAMIAKKIDALVTGPINKKTIQSDLFNLSGHTSFFEQKLVGDALMFMVSEKLRVALLTDHIPIKDISKYITKEIVIKKILQLENSLKNDFLINNPKIAVLSLNPHVGDKGVIGEEDILIIKPVIDELNEKGHLIFGPYAADSFFGKKNFLNYDAILAAYHDQGLIPFKTLTFGEGINFTAGLNKVRTSPDHGTAFEIAGKGLAKIDSFKTAIYMARKIYFNRIKKSKNN